MRSIDTDILSALESGAIKSFSLLDMTIDETDYRFTDCDVPIAVSGTLYTPRHFEASSIKYSTSNIVDSATITMDNLDDLLTAAFVGGTPQGSSVTLYLALLDSANALVSEDVPTLFQGEIDDWSLREGMIEFDVVNALVAWNKRTLSKQSPSCRWRVFKGTECGYSGTATWCDRTFSRCQDLGNTANFGGERWLPSIVDKTVWWGREPA